MHDDHISKQNHKIDSKNPLTLDLILLALHRPGAYIPRTLTSLQCQIPWSYLDRMLAITGSMPLRQIQSHVINTSKIIISLNTLDGNHEINQSHQTDLNL